MENARHPSTLAGGEVPTLADARPAEGVTRPEGRGRPTEHDPMIGREILGQFRVISKLGHGGMGSVYLAEQPQMQRRAAIKVLHPDLDSNAEAVRRFKAEARAIARLQDPHIVAVYNFGALDSGELFLAMEFLEGRTLRRELSTCGRLPVARVLDIADQCAVGLNEAHRNHVIHRDLKPSNVMLLDRSPGDFVKLLDFGIAKVDGGGTNTKGWMGTPQYMAPEQFTGKPVDARADVYALGLLVYEMLCGRPPFVNDTPMSYVHSHVYQPPPKPESFAPGAVPPSVERVVLAALEKNPGARPQSAMEFATALRSASALVAAPRKSSVGPIVLAAVLGVVAVAGAGTAAYWTWGRDESPTDADPPSESPRPVEPVSTPEVPPVVASPVAAVDEQPETLFEPGLYAELPEESRALLKLDLDELRRRFDASLKFYPPSQRKTVKDQYMLQMAAMGPGARADAQRKVMIISFLNAMKSAAKVLPQDERTTEELVEAYLAQEGPMTREMKLDVMNNMRAAVPDEADADWTVRNWLLAMEAEAKR